MTTIPATIPINNHGHTLYAGYYTVLADGDIIIGTPNTPIEYGEHSGRIMYGTWHVCPDLGLMRWNPPVDKEICFVCQHGAFISWRGQDVRKGKWVSWHPESQPDLRMPDEMATQAKIANAAAQQAIRLVTAPDLSPAELKLIVGDVRTLMRLAVALYRDSRDWAHRNMLPIGDAPAAAYLSDVLERTAP